MHKPALKKMFKPDPGFTFFEIDLKQADAQVVAWEAEDAELMEIFTRINAGEKGLDVHRENAKVAYATTNITPHMRQISKSLVHGTNYFGTPRGMSRRIGLTVRQIEVFQNRWFAAHPGIKKWHQRIELQLQTRRYIENPFGYRRWFFGRVEGLLPEALAWIPQSTVALVINHGAVRTRSMVPEVVPLMQIHDSFAGQFETVLYDDLRPRLKTAMEVSIPYSKPLVIGTDLKVSTLSWGHCEKVSWVTGLEEKKAA